MRARNAFNRTRPERWYRPLALALTLLFFLDAILYARDYIASLDSRGIPVGNDLVIYLERARAWLGGDGFYRPGQLTGVPYVVQEGDAVYPPTVLLLLLPFTVLPAILWWAIPVAIMAAAFARARPSPWSWPVLAALPMLVLHGLQVRLFVHGNPSMWALAALAAGAAWSWPTAFAAMKLTLAPFALIGVWRRRYWIGVAIGAGESLLFVTEWPSFLVAMTNARNESGWPYLFGEWPMAAGVVIALSGRRGDPPGPIRTTMR